MATPAGIASKNAAATSGFRLIPRIDTYPRVVLFAQTTPGKVAVLCVFSIEMRYFVPNFASVLAFTFLIGLMTFMPEHRRFVLAVAPLAYVVMSNIHQPVRLGLTLAVIAAGILLYLCAMRWPKSLFGRRPITFLLVGFTALICAACTARAHTRMYVLLWTSVEIMATYVWFIGYALIDRNSQPGRDLTLEVATFRPLWGSTNTPFPKGAAYLRRIEAKTPKELAVTQLKALKLLGWTILLAMLLRLWTPVFHEYLGMPTVTEALAMSVRGTPVAWHLRWESQMLFFFKVTLEFAVMGDKIIALCRMAGFNALRNSYRPLSSTTISEFFNRFYYYFKELLVDFFYYPAFMRYFKKHRRLRMVFATFVAIAFGNSFYHLTRDWIFFKRTDCGSRWKITRSCSFTTFYWRPQ